MSAFRFVHQVPVRFRDVDLMGHAHHSLPLVYIEEARTAYWHQVAGREQLDFVIGGVALRFVERILFPSTLSVGVRAIRLGRSSFDMEYEIRDEDGTLLVTGTTSQVMFDYDRGETKPIPDELRARLAEYDGV